jgi:predicted HTH transcriptional regulator
MTITLNRLLGFLQGLFSSEQESRKRNRAISKVVRRIEFAQTMQEWEELGDEVKRMKQMYEYEGKKELQYLQKIYNRKGIELGNRLRNKPSYPRPIRKW